MLNLENLIRDLHLWCPHMWEIRPRWTHADGVCWDGVWWDGIWWDGVWWDGVWWDWVWWDGIWWDGVWWDKVWWDGVWWRSGPHRRLQNNLEPTDVILSSPYAMKLAYFVPEFRLWTK